MEGKLLRFNLSIEQCKKLVDALRDDRYWPRHTSDPYVNWVVDCLIDEESAGEYDETVYTAEVQAFRDMEKR